MTRVLQEGTESRKTVGPPPYYNFELMSAVKMAFTYFEKIAMDLDVRFFFTGIVTDRGSELTDVYFSSVQLYMYIHGYW